MTEVSEKDFFKSAFEAFQKESGTDNSGKDKKDENVSYLKTDFGDLKIAKSMEDFRNGGFITAESLKTGKFDDILKTLGGAAAPSSTNTTTTTETAATSKNAPSSSQPENSSMED